MEEEIKTILIQKLKEKNVRKFNGYTLGLHANHIANALLKKKGIKKGSTEYETQHPKLKELIKSIHKDLPAQEVVKKSAEPEIPPAQLARETSSVQETVEPPVVAEDPEIARLRKELKEYKALVASSKTIKAELATKIQTAFRRYKEIKSAKGELEKKKEEKQVKEKKLKTLEKGLKVAVAGKRVAKALKKGVKKIKETKAEKAVSKLFKKPDDPEKQEIVGIYERGHTVDDVKYDDEGYISYYRFIEKKNNRTLDYGIHIKRTKDARIVSVDELYDVEKEEIEEAHERKLTQKPRNAREKEIQDYRKSINPIISKRLSDIDVENRLHKYHHLDDKKQIEANIRRDAISDSLLHIDTYKLSSIIDTLSQDYFAKNPKSRSHPISFRNMYDTLELYAIEQKATGEAKDDYKKLFEMVKAEMYKTIPKEKIQESLTRVNKKDASRYEHDIGEMVKKFNKLNKFFK